MSVAELLKPGDAPPFWDGMWHPEGKAEGAVLVKPRMYDGAAPVAAQAVPLSATATVPASNATVIPVPEPVIAAPPPAADPIIAAPPPAADPIIAAPPPAADPIIAAPPAAPAPEAPIAQPPAVPAPAPAAPIAQPPAPPPAAPAAPQPGTGPLPAGTGPLGGAPRSLVVSLLSQGPVETAPTIPGAPDAARAEALRAKAKELQTQGQLGQSLATIAEAIKAAPGDPATYAQMGQILMAGRALEDAAHHFLIAYMLAPKEPGYARMTLHASWALGYVAWSFQIAQALYKVQPAQDLLDLGKQAAAWLQGGRPAGFTTLCTSCRANAMSAQGGTCPKCAQPAMGGPANAAGFMGLRLLQQTPPTGRLFAGAACVSCFQESAVLVTKGGPKCLKCQDAVLAAM